MTSPIHVLRLPAPPLQRSEILRYAGCPQEDAATLALLEDCLAEAEPVLTYQICWRELSLHREDGSIDLGLVRSKSRTLARGLENCGHAVLFAATVGLGLDRLIARYGRLSPARALFFQAIGTERVEALCDAFQEELRRRYRPLGVFPRRRFSPGYGDLPLSLQREIFSVLDCPRQIGLTLNESLLMSPSKSVTALVGLTPLPDDGCTDDNKCRSCPLWGCAFRCD